MVEGGTGMSGMLWETSEDRRRPDDRRQRRGRLAVRMRRTAAIGPTAAAAAAAAAACRGRADGGCSCGCGCDAGCDVDENYDDDVVAVAVVAVVVVEMLSSGERLFQGNQILQRLNPNRRHPIPFSFLFFFFKF